MGKSAKQVLAQKVIAATTDNTSIKADALPPKTDAEIASEVKEGITAYHGSKATFTEFDPEYAGTGDMVAEQAIKQNIKAFHGSPADFEEFMLEYIGTGEGNQAYGWGLYFAENPDVAKGYRADLSQMHNADAVTAAGDKIPSWMFNAVNQGEWASVDADLAERIAKAKQYGETEKVDHLTNLKKVLEDYHLGNVDATQGKLYEVNIDADKSELLDWDKPLSEQSDKIKQSLLKLGEDNPNLFSKDEMRILQGNPNTAFGTIWGDMSGQQAYNTLAERLNRYPGTDFGDPKSPQEASKILDLLGVKGIKYADQQSRGAEGGTSNFVIFNPRVIEIAKKFNVALPIAAQIAKGAAVSYGVLALTPKQAQAEPIAQYENSDKPEVQEALSVLDRVQKQSSISGYDEYGSPIYDQKPSALKKVIIPAGNELIPTPRSQEPVADTETSQDIEYRVAQAMQDSADYDYLKELEGLKSEGADGDLPPVDPNATGVSGVLADIGKGMIEAPTQALAGFLDATGEMAEFMESIIPLGGETMRIDAQPTTVTSSLVRGVSQFLTGMVGPNKVQQFLKVPKALRPFVAGAFADAFAFDPNDPNLANMLKDAGFEEYAPDIINYLAADPSDTEAEARFKKALEGAGIGLGVETVMKGFKFIKGMADAKKAAVAVGAGTVQQAAEESGVLAKHVDEAMEGDFIPFEQKAKESQVEFETRDYGTGEGKADPDAAMNINLDNLETPEDVMEMINAVARADNVEVNAARRETITFEETEALAYDLNMTVEDLMSRRKGQAFNAEELLAARKIMLASAENLTRLAERAKTGSPMDLALFRRAMSVHRGIQQQVSGATAEAGRALSAMRIMAKSQKEQDRMIMEAVDAAGGDENIRAMAEMVSMAKDTREINEAVKASFGQKTRAAMYEAWINGILSSPTTQMANIVSNAAIVMTRPLERKLANVMGGGKNVVEGEATANLIGAVEGFMEGLILAGRAIKTGEASDTVMKLEMGNQRAISAEALELSGNLGRSVDMLGEVIRLPGRFLTAGDELFKATGYRMEIRALAHRKAFNEGLTGDALNMRVAEIIENPPADLHMEAFDTARYQTFTNPLRGSSKKIEEFRNANPVAKVIIPFIRTPINIMAYTMERTPLAPVVNKFREDIAAGGAKADMAKGQLALGSMILAVTADHAMRGQITGAGPKDPGMRAVLRAQGWQPYSVKIGDTYYAYNRLDPVGMLMGLSADTTEVIGQAGEEDSARIAIAGSVAIAQNLFSKSYLQGVSDLFEALLMSSTDPAGSIGPMERYLTRQTASVVPYTSLLSAVERQVDPTLRSAFTVVDEIRSRTPGFSEDLPPRRNMFGEPIVLEGGIGPDIMSPVYVSSDKKDRVADELAIQQAGIRMPRKTIRDY